MGKTKPHGGLSIRTPGHILVFPYQGHLLQTLLRGFRLLKSILVLVTAQETPFLLIWHKGQPYTPLMIKESGHSDEGVATSEDLIELAKDILNPVRCEWGIGTKDACGVVLTSWTLLRKV